MSLPWFKMYQRPFLMATMHLTTEARGAYLLLMFSYYDQEKPPVDDDEALAQITGLSVERWRHHRKLIEPFFTIVDGFWRNEKCEDEIAARRKQGGNSRENGKGGGRPKKPAGQPSTNPQRNPSGSPAGFHQGTQTEPDFGPSQAHQNPPANLSGNPVGFDQVKTTHEKPSGLPDGLPSMVPASNPSGGEIEDIRKKEEGANAPSSAGVDLIGSLIDLAFQPSAEAVGIALNEGVPSTELAGWLDDWKQRCIDAGTRSTDWHAAWAREYDRRAKERAKARPKPKVSVSKKRLDRIPDNWEPNETHYAITEERRLDMRRCIESFSDYILNKRPDWKDANAAFRNWLKSPHRTEFIHGQTTQRRAPAPSNGGSILDAFDRLADNIARASRAAAQDHEDGQAPVLSLPEE